MSFRMAAAKAYAAVGDLADARRHLDEATRVSEMWQGGTWPLAVAALRAEVDATAAPRTERLPAP